MFPVKRPRGGIAATVLLAALPAWSQSRLEADRMQLYGGTYSPHCGDQSAPRLVVKADALMVEANHKRMTARNPQAAFSYFGNSPPPNFDVALLGEVRPGVSLEFHVYHDRKGRYAKLDGDPKVRAALGGLVAQAYRHCVAGEAALGAPPQPAARPAVAAPASASGVMPGDLLQQAGFKRAYLHALGSYAREHWLAALDGPQSLTKILRLGGVEYIHGGACKAHDCGDNNVSFLYAAESGTVYAKALVRARPVLLGGPPPVVAAELERVWQSDWRRR
ncbi:MAG: hypothetical protein JNM98_06960 [Rhodocyclaceae bacterium]|nr:hypothetical protein [Rhodocyclaceae bacterium]